MLCILGGGQLGKFFVTAAQKLGYQVTVLDPDQKSPAGLIADEHICAQYDDLGALDQIIKSCYAVTTEFENIPFSTLEYLENGLIVHPSSQAVSIAQNRILEKTFLADNNFPVGPFRIIKSRDDVNQVSQDFFPAILKNAQFGYDGKGQIHVSDLHELNQVYSQSNDVPCVLEKKLPLNLEMSVVIARSTNGDHVYFPLAENHHTNGVLDITICPGRVSKDIADKAKEYAHQIAIKLSYVGVLAVEFFLVDGNIFVNEIAPRPHNSGHYSLDACINNQFDMQVRALTNLELVDPGFHTNTVMINLLGDLWFTENILRDPNFDILLDEPDVKLHMYGKKEPRKGRKMAHFNVSGSDLSKVLSKAKLLKEML